MAGSGPVKVAILGGGMGALAAAWELTHQPGAAERYDITVYQRGWRLGGKGASGRNLGMEGRIEEHGLHILMGFYDHALRVIKEAYDEVQGQVVPWHAALTPGDDVFIAEPPSPGGTWDFWRISFPPNAGQPGVDAGVPSIVEALRRGVQWMVSFHRSLEHALAAPLHVAEELLGFTVSVASAAPFGLHLIADATEHVLRVVWEIVEGRVETDVHVRRLWIGLALAGGNVIGMIRDAIFMPQDFATIDDQDYRDWLAHHLARVGCPLHLSSHSPPVTALYDLAFSRDTTFAAGTLLFDLLLLVFSYKGHAYYRMNGGMGDIVFAPLYLALQARGVKFCFFQRVMGVHLDAQQQAIGAVSIEEQVRDSQTYQPLIQVHELPCWPNQPLLPEWEEARERGERYDFEFDPAPSPFGTGVHRLAQGRDFDVVVLGISIAALPGLCPELAQANAGFARMLGAVQTIRTRAIQLWLLPDRAGLGWTAGTALAGFLRPFNSCADMTQVLGQEDWREAKPQTIAYFCDAINDDEAPDDPAAAAAIVRTSAIDWLTADVWQLWPRAGAPGRFDWSVLADPSAAQGVARFDSQYWRANVDPSERYVLSVKGSTVHRLAPGGSGFRNLALAGDWVRTELNAGCLEAATMGGLGAGRAIVTGLVRP